MRITSLLFFIFLFVSVVMYYIFPKKYRWIVLLISSLFFFLQASSIYMLCYLLSGIIATYFGAIFINKTDNEKNKKIILGITLLIIIGQLFVFKYLNIFPITANKFASLFNLNFTFGTLNLIAPLGISYYTLSLISYVVDVYRTVSLPQENFLKHSLFACYYPSMISGPIMRFEEMKKSLFEERKTDLNNIIQGFYRLVFGLLKKMVIADQLAIIVKFVFNGSASHTGLFIIIGLLAYAIQIYNDFSGCMDIVIGASKMYGVKMPENFDSPLLSRNLSEFWRRWHISLGTWAKDYIMYPLLMTKFFQNIGTKCKKKFGKKIGKQIPTFLAILILWLLIGLWHGTSYKYIFAAGILPWIYLTTSELCEVLLTKITTYLKIKTNTFSYRLFESFRTLALMCFLWLFVCVSSLSDSLSTLKSIFVFSDISFSKIFNLVPSKAIIVALMLVFVVDYLNYKGINAFEKFEEQNIWFRYMVLLLIIAIILVYGAYGAEYNPADFIYGGF